MNDNERLHKAFGICWHKFEKLVVMPELSRCVCGKDIRMFQHEFDLFHDDPNHVYKPHCAQWNQDLLAQVSMPCEDCGGEGTITDKSNFISGALKPLPYTCPTCNGLKTRRITRLQQIMDERGEWEEFYAYLLVDADGIEIALDANKLGAAALEWKVKS